MQNGIKEVCLESDLNEGVRPILEGAYRYLTGSAQDKAKKVACRESDKTDDSGGKSYV